MRIADREIGPGSPVFCVADLGASHCQDFTVAAQLIEAAKKAGADAVKFQSYTPESVSVDSDRYRLTKGPWKGWKLWDLYKESHTPKEWFPTLFNEARQLGLIPFSTPSCPEDVDFLEALDCPAYKIASHDIVYLELISYAANTGKPVILSTGMAALREIGAAVRTTDLENAALLHCVSAYPAPLNEMHLANIRHDECEPHPVYGLSDHTMRHLTAVCAVAAGACIVEKHIGFEHLREKSHDGGFYANPQQFKRMVEAIREAEEVMGEVKYGPTDSESTEFRRRLCWARDLPAGHTITRSDILVVCGAVGMLANELDTVVGSVLDFDVTKHSPALSYAAA